MIPLIDMPGGWEWLIILVIVLIVFGARKLPDIARSSGQAMRIFRDETRQLKADEKKAKEATAANDGTVVEQVLNTEAAAQPTSEQTKPGEPA